MAKKTKTSLRKIDTYFRKKPVRLSLGVIFLGFVLVTGFEITRAVLYQARVEVYKNSKSIIAIKDSADLIADATEANNTSYFCVLQPFGEIKNQQQTIDNAVAVDNRPSTQVAAIHAQATQELSQVPTFGSPLELIPSVQTARQTSDSLTESLTLLAETTAADNRRDYCNELDNVFARLYFLQELSRIQGVSALFPGQIEDFQTRSREAQEYFLTLNPPVELREEHVALNQIFNQLAVDLRKDTRDVEQFASTIRENIESINTTLKTLAEETAELQRLPVQILIFVDSLR